MTSADALLAELEPTVGQPARAPPRHHQGVVPARARAVEPGPRLRARLRVVARRGRSSSDEVRSALFVNLLTEDNLPYYFRTIERMFGADSAVGHVGPPLDRRGGPPLDRASATTSPSPGPSTRCSSSGPAWPRSSAARCPSPRRPLDGFVYVALQELATRIAHHNTGKLLDDQAGYEVMKQVASDENRHYLFYRDLVDRGARARPVRAWCCAIERQVRTFEMPGTGILDFEAHAKAIAKRRHLRLRRPPRPDPRAGRAPPLERRGPRGPHPRGRAGPGRAGEADRPHRQGRPALRRPPRREPRELGLASEAASQARRRRRRTTPSTVCSSVAPDERQR